MNLSYFIDFCRKIPSFFHALSINLYESRLFKGFRVALSLLFFANLLHVTAAFATDDLSGLMKTVGDDFGKDSSFVKLLYLAEGITAIVAYVKSKNFMVFIGIVGLSLFVNWALPKWVFGS